MWQRGLRCVWYVLSHDAPVQLIVVMFLCLAAVVVACRSYDRAHSWIGCKSVNKRVVPVILGQNEGRRQTE